MFDTHQAFMLLSVCIPQEQDICFILWLMMEENYYPNYILELGEIETDTGRTLLIFKMIYNEA